MSHPTSPPLVIRPAAAPPPIGAGWRLGQLRQSPHRLGFFAGGVLLATSGLWWALALLLRRAGVAQPWDVAPPVAHGLLMALGFLPLFIVGFLFTAGPRWLGLPDERADGLVRPVAAMLLGWCLALPGFHAAAALAGLGLVVVAAGWGVLVLRFARLLRASPATDTVHARTLLGACALGVLAMALAAAALLRDHVPAARAAVQLALWGFLTPAFLAVMHRMLPFFTASALPFHKPWRPTWVLAVLVAVSALTALGAMAEALGGPPGAATHAVLLAVQAPAAALALWLVWRWGLRPALRVRLLAMLHLGFAWLGVALGLAAASHARALLSGQALPPDLAALHALTMGFLGGTLLAMASRVAAGHSGRPLVADRLLTALVGLVHTAAALRVGAALWPAGETVLTLAAALAWALAGGAWALRYGAWFGRPRVDGKPG